MKKDNVRFSSMNLVFTVWAAFCILSSCDLPASDTAFLLHSSSNSSASYDPDLGAWSTASWTPFTVADSITGFAWGSGGAGKIYVAVSSTGVIGYSRDGDIWEAAGPAPSRPLGPAPYDPLGSSRIHFNAVAYGGGMFVAVGNAGKIAYSSDGIGWTAGPSGGINGFGTTNIYGIAYGAPGAVGKSVFVAVGENANIAYSTNGATWSGGTVGAFSNVQLNDVCFGDGNFYIVGNGGHTGKSSNPAAESWTHYLYNSGTAINTGSINKIAFGSYGNDPGVAVVYNDGLGTSRKIAVIKATDFALSNTWDANLDSGYFGDNTIRGIAYGGGYFVAVGTGSMIGFWPGADKDNDYNRYWRVLSFHQFRYWEITALAALNGRFYVGNIGGKVGYSR
jgi:hypothetical protein